MVRRRGISPVIATVIIVAVAIAISIAVAGWLFGVFGGVSKTESLKIFPDSYIDVTNKQLVLHVQNVGGSPAQIYKIEVSGSEITTATVTTSSQGAATTTTSLPVIIKPGEDVYLKVPLSGITAASGVAYSVTIYTEAGNVYTATVYGK